MERNYDEVISDMLIQLDRIERRMDKADRRMEAFDKRMDLTIRRMVKSEERMELFDKKLRQSINDQKQFSLMQSEMNKFFLDLIKTSNGKK